MRVQLKMAEVKSYDFVKDYFSDPTVLVAAIKKYHEISKVQKGEYTLLDLLRWDRIKICKGACSDCRRFYYAEK